MIKEIKRFGKKKLNQFKLKRYRVHLKGNDLKKDLNNLGIERGDIILIHSSLKSIGYVVGGGKTVIEAFLDVVGQEGTLMVPTYPRRGSMYNTCNNKNYIFDYTSKKTAMGAIPSEFLKLRGVFRSIHPTHSISAIGKYVKEITETHHIGDKTFGENSPWGKLIKLNGKILGIGITLGPTTQYHYIEDIMGEDFPIKTKVDKIFKLKCKIGDNKYINVDVNPLDPEVAKTRIDKKDSAFIRNYFWEIYKKLGILKVGKIGEAPSWWVNARRFIEVLMDLAKLNITIYSTKEELIKNNLYPYDLISEKLN